jgi:predicted AlkP superfamily pyrophosphatase or phosphodiesterase
MPSRTSTFAGVTTLAAAVLSVAGCAVARPRSTNPAAVRHALLISVDGMHGIDLALHLKDHPDSTLASLARRGVVYSNARQPLLGDSSPGLLSIATGGSPYSTGIVYSPTYDRTLSPPGSDCKTRGTVLYIDEKSVRDFGREDSGGGIDPDKLPRDPERGCTPVYPHQLQRVNNIFEVVKQAGGRTAWIDQHLMYSDMLRGPSGAGLDDNFVLEANRFRKSLDAATGQDKGRVQALLNQIRGYDSSGKNKVGVPMLFGLGFISVGVMQKVEGYEDGGAIARPGLAQSIGFVDQQLARIVGELKSQGLYDSTLIVLTAKHGQSPIEVRQRRVIDRNLIRDAVNGVQPGLLAQGSLDTIAILWLKDRSKTSAVVAALRAKLQEAGIYKIFAGEELKLLLDPNDPRTPDLIVQPMPGTFYADGVETPATKALLAEHGGMLDEDTLVPLLVSLPGGAGQMVRSPVQTSQIAPTVLVALGLDPDSLEAVRKEYTAPLPGLAGPLLLGTATPHPTKP